MQVLENEIAIRRLPDLLTHEDGTKVTPETWEKRRAELLDILLREEYGYAPAAPQTVTVTPLANPDSNAYAGKVTEEHFSVAFPTETGEFSFPVSFFRPNHPIITPAWQKNPVKKPPLFLLLNFRPETPDKYFPIEEITDAGFACAQIYYEDVTSDNGDFTNGMAGQYPSARNGNTGWGKLRMWAFAASRALDAFLMRDDIDRDKIVVIGHSRLGKTALLAGATDTRFAGAVSNDSGCSGAAITREKCGERVADITKNFPYWFCPNYLKYIGKEAEMPFDQHYLTALLAPRLLCIGSAWEDTWADPAREFLSAVLTAPVYTLCDGKDAENEPLPFDRYPAKGEAFTFAGSRIHYHLRPGTHFFSREDWNQYIAFLSAHFFR